MTDLKMRKLTGQDTFKILGLLDELEVADLFTGLSVDTSNVENVGETIQGATFLNKLIKSLTKNLPNMQDEVNEFLADIYQTDIETILELSFKDYINLVIEFFKHDDFKDFLTFISSSSN